MGLEVNIDTLNFDYQRLNDNFHNLYKKTAKNLETHYKFFKITKFL